MSRLRCRFKSSASYCGVGGRGDGSGFRAFVIVVWCVRPPPARVWTPGSHPPAAPRVVAATIASRRCIRGLLVHGSFWPSYSAVTLFEWLLILKRQGTEDAELGQTG